MNFDHIGLQLPRILLPKQGTDMQAWSVIACDQYTSDREYWQRLEQKTSGVASTLNLIFPEVNLEDDDCEQRIAGINAAMESYLSDGSLVEQAPAFILLNRKTAEVESRKGLIVALDLEKYDYNKGAKSLIRATEGTILDRLPPRIKVRKNAPIELPHIMVLIDDPKKTVIEPLFDQSLETVYDFELMENGGHLTGYRIDQPELISQITTALETLADKESYQQKYNVDEDVMLYAMGDGNHSFATAKAIWQQLKDDVDSGEVTLTHDQLMAHPARFALVELVNVHDEGLEFEAIHRVMFSIDEDNFLNEMESYFSAQNMAFSFTAYENLAEAEKNITINDAQHSFPCIIAGTFGVCCIDKPKYTLVVATLQDFLDHYLEKFSSSRIDYIHGDQSVTDLGAQKNCAGFYLPAISKHDLFKTIVLDGALPRKTFSMGEADEKRFYLECRRIK
jgi:hypothetical protein